MRYVAFLRGVSPTNARMPDLKRCFELAGFTNVRTVLSSGNVVFDARSGPVPQIERKAESAMAKHLGRSFLTIVRPVEALSNIIESDAYRGCDAPETAKRVVTFWREPREPAIPLPTELDGARILHSTGREAFTIYVPSPRGPVFMTLLEKTFGSDVTTRTWDTVQKCAKA